MILVDEVNIALSMITSSYNDKLNERIKFVLKIFQLAWF